MYGICFHQIWEWLTIKLLDIVEARCDKHISFWFIGHDLAPEVVHASDISQVTSDFNGVILIICVLWVESTFNGTVIMIVH